MSQRANSIMLGGVSTPIDSRWALFALALEFYTPALFNPGVNLIDIPD